MRHRKRAPLASRGIIVARVCTRVSVFIEQREVNNEKMVCRAVSFSIYVCLPSSPSSPTSPDVDTSRRLHGTAGMI